MTIPDKENLVPDSGGINSIKLRTQRSIDRNRKLAFDTSNIDNVSEEISELCSPASTARRSLVNAALQKESTETKSCEALFQHDAACLVHLSPEASTQAQIKLLEQDTKDLQNASYSKLRIWLSLAQFVEKSGMPKCARLVYQHMFKCGIAKYYKELYEQWSGFAARNYSIDEAAQVIDYAVKSKVIDSNQKSSILKSWLAKSQTEVDGDVTVAFQSGSSGSSRSQGVTSPTNINDNSEKRRDSGGAASRKVRTISSRENELSATPAKAEPTVVLNSSRTGVRSTALRSSIKRTGLLSKQTKLTKIGRAQRVVLKDEETGLTVPNQNETVLSPGASNSGDPQSSPDSSLGVIAEGDGSSTGTGSVLTPSSDKSSIKERIGDLSYIKNWKPEHALRSPNQDTHPEPLKENEPTQTMPIGDQEDKDAPAKPTVRAPLVDDKPPTVVLRRTHSGLEGSAAKEPRLSANASITSGIAQHGDRRDSLPVEARGFHDSMFSNKNLFMVNGRPYLRLAVIGRGGSSKVFKVLAIGEDEPQIYALKRIKLSRSDASALSSFKNEISLLERLRGNPHIITLIDSEIDHSRKVIYVVMEHGEIDLNLMLQQQRAAKPEPGMVGNLSVNFIRLVWMNMLQAVHAIHEERIVHGDLKPANFLFVKGKLKLIDFGIAKAISNDTTNIMRDTQVGTLNFMSPESIIDINSAPGSRPKIGAPGMKLKQGRASDIWSMGCILYLLVYGQTPFHELKLIQKIHCISDPNYKIAFPELEVPYPDMVDSIKECLQFDPARRSPIVDKNGRRGLLSHPFLNPNACTPTAAATTNSSSTKALRQKLHRIVEQVCENAAKIEQVCNEDPGRMEQIVDNLVNHIIEDMAPSAPDTIEQSRPPPSHQRRTSVPPNMPRVQEESTADLDDDTDSQSLYVHDRQFSRPSRAAPTASEESSFSAPPRPPKPAPSPPDSHLPTNLQTSIVPGRATLKPLGQSDSPRYMRPKSSTPENNGDLASILRKGLESK